MCVMCIFKNLFVLKDPSERWEDPWSKLKGSCIPEAKAARKVVQGVALGGMKSCRPTAPASPNFDISQMEESFSCSTFMDGL